MEAFGDVSFFIVIQENAGVIPGQMLHVICKVQGGHCVLRFLKRNSLTENVYES